MVARPLLLTRQTTHVGLIAAYRGALDPSAQVWVTRRQYLVFVEISALVLFFCGSSTSSAPPTHTGSLFSLVPF